MFYVSLYSPIRRLACSAVVIIYTRVFTGRRLIETFWYIPAPYAAQPTSRGPATSEKMENLRDCLSFSFAHSLSVCAWISVAFDSIKQTVNWLENKHFQLKQADPPQRYKKSWHTLQIARSWVWKARLIESYYLLLLLHLQGIPQSCICISCTFFCIYCFVLLSLTIGMSTINLHGEEHNVGGTTLPLELPARHVKWNSSAPGELQQQ